MSSHVASQMVSSGQDDSCLLSLVDVMVRAMRNPKIPDAYVRLYDCLVEKFPQLLEGETVLFQVHELREAAGWKSKRLTASFLKALVEIGAIQYDMGNFNKSANQRTGTIVPNEEIFPYPETFDLRQTKEAKKARESAREKQRELKAALLPVECPQCGNAHLLYDITAKCPDCGHVQEPYVGIPSRLITVDEEASLDDVFDGLLEEEK